MLPSGTSVTDAYGDDEPPRYHRSESPTQTPAIAARQEASGELWGGVPQFGSFPAVQAFSGPLPPGARGVEFVTAVPPDRGSPPSQAYWRRPRPGVVIEVEADGREYAKIKVVVTKNSQR